MKKIISLICVLSFLTILALGITPADQAHAAIWTDFGAATNFGEYASLVIQWATPVIGLFALIMVIYAGYVYMTSQGNPEQVNLAKDILIGVIAGVILLFTAEILLKNVIGAKYGL